MEWDTDRAGGFEPLRFLPKDKNDGAGASSPPRQERIEKKDDLKRRIDEAAKDAPIEQLCLSPAVRLASTEEGNDPHRGRAMAEAGAGGGNRP